MYLFIFLSIKCDVSLPVVHDFIQVQITVSATCILDVLLSLFLSFIIKCIKVNTCRTNGHWSPNHIVYGQWHYALM